MSSPCLSDNLGLVNLKFLMDAPLSLADYELIFRTVMPSPNPTCLGKIRSKTFGSAKKLMEINFLFYSCVVDLFFRRMNHFIITENYRYPSCGRVPIIVLYSRGNFVTMSTRLHIASRAICISCRRMHPNRGLLSKAEGFVVIESPILQPLINQRGVGHLKLIPGKESVSYMEGNLS